MNKNNFSVKKFSALGAIICGVLFTLTALFSIWEVSPFLLGVKGGVISRLVPSLALLTLAPIILLVILRLLDEKK